MDKLQTEVFEAYEKLIKDGNKDVTTLLKKYKTKQDELVEKVSKIVLENISDDGTLADGAYTEQIKDEIKKNLSELAQEEEDFTTDLLESSYKQSFKDTSAALGADWKILRQEFVDAALNYKTEGKSFSSRIWNNCDDLANRIYSDINDIIKTGKRPNHVASQIKKDYGVTAYQAKRLVNTELARVVNDAQMEVYKNSAAVERLMWCATLDKNSCEDCAEMDGQYYDKDKAPKLPKHPNCRCCFLPVTDTWTPKQRADNETKQNISYKTYNQWAGN